MKDARIMRTRVIGGTLAFVALLLWLLSINEAKVNLETRLNIGDLGLVTILPVTYFVSLALLTFSFLITLKSNKKKEKLLFIQVIMLIFFLFLTPTLIEDNRARYSYSAYGFADYIIRNGQIDPAKVWYHNWPTFFLLIATFISITGIPPETLVKAFPTFPQILYFLPLFLFASKVLKGTEKKWLAIWVFYVANWIGQDFLSPQGIGFFLYALIIYLLYDKWSTEKNKAKSRPKFLLIIPLFVVLATGHLLTSLALLSILLALYVFGYFKNLNFIALLIAITASWNIHGAIVYFESNLPSFVSQGLRFDLIATTNISERVTGSYGHVLVTQTKILFTALILFFASSGAFLCLKSRKHKNVDEKILAGLVGIAIFVLLLPYGGELFMRIYLLGLIMIVYFISENMDSKKLFVLLLVFLIIALPLHIIARYGNERYDCIPLGEVKGSNFFFDNVQYGDVVGGSPWGNFRKSYDDYVRVSFQIENLSQYEEKLLMPTKLGNEGWPLYLILNEGDTAYFTIFYDAPGFIAGLTAKINDSPRYNKIYTNPNFNLHLSVEHN